MCHVHTSFLVGSFFSPVMFESISQKWRSRAYCHQPGLYKTWKYFDRPEIQTQNLILSRRAWSLEKKCGSLKNKHILKQKQDVVAAVLDQMVKNSLYTRLAIQNQFVFASLCMICPQNERSADTGFYSFMCSRGYYCWSNCLLYYCLLVLKLGALLFVILSKCDQSSCCRFVEVTAHCSVISIFLRIFTTSNHL